MVQLDHDEKMANARDVWNAGCWVGGTAHHQWSGDNGLLVCLLRKAVGPTVVPVDNKGIIHGLWRGKMKCIGPRAKDTALWILIWEEVRRVHQGGILVKVEHVKAH